MFHPNNSNWVPEKTVRALAYWEQYKRENDLRVERARWSGLTRRRAGLVRPSMHDVHLQKVADGVTETLLCLWVGRDYYCR